MNKEEFEIMTKEILGEQREEIISLAESHYKSEGRGLVQVQIDGAQDVILSWVPLAELRELQKASSNAELDYRTRQVETISTYWPDNQVAVVVTDGEHESFSLRVKHAM